MRCSTAGGAKRVGEVRVGRQGAGEPSLDFGRRDTERHVKGRFPGLQSGKSAQDGIASEERSFGNAVVEESKDVAAFRRTPRRIDVLSDPEHFATKASCAVHDEIAHGQTPLTERPPSRTNG